MDTEILQHRGTPKYLLTDTDSIVVSMEYTSLSSILISVKLIKYIRIFGS